MAINFPVHVRVLVVPVRIMSGVGVGKDGRWFVRRGLCPCHGWFLSLWGSWPEQPDLPQVAMDMEITSKIEHKMVFVSPPASLEKKTQKRIFFCLFLLILFGSRQKWSFLYLLETHKARFLVKSATGGRQSNIAWAQRICCACEIILLTVSLLPSRLLWFSRRRGSEWGAGCLDCTTAFMPPVVNNCSTDKNTLSVTYNTFTLASWTLKGFFFPLLPSLSVSQKHLFLKRQWVEILHS